MSSDIYESAYDKEKLRLKGNCALREYQPMQAVINC